MKIDTKLRRLRKGNTLFIKGKEYHVIKKERTTIVEHKPLNEILIWLTDNRMISVDNDGYNVYKMIRLGPIQLLWRIWKKPTIKF